MTPDHEIMTLHLDRETRNAIDRIASATQRDRDAIIHEAIDAYLDVHRRQADHIRKGLRQAEAGEFASEHDVRAAFLK